MSDLLDLVLAAHSGLERWREVRYLDVRLSASGGLFQIKGHPEGLHDVIMRIETHAACSHLCSLWASPITAATSLQPACGSKIARVVSSRNMSTLVRRSPATPSRHPGIGYSCSISRATPIGITSPLRFCSHSLVSTSARWGHMKNMGRPGNGRRCNFHRLSRLIVQNRPSISMRKAFFSDSTMSPRSLAQQGRTIVSITHRSLGWYFRRSACVVGLTPTGPLISGPTVVLLLISDIVVLTNL